MIASVFILIAGIVAIKSFDEALSKRTKLPGDVVTKWYHVGSWNSSTKTNDRPSYFIQAKTSMGTFDFDITEGEYADFNPGDKVSCVIGKGYFDTYPIRIMVQIK
jgi:hypothetical protein